MSEQEKPAYLHHESCLTRIGGPSCTCDHISPGRKHQQDQLRADLERLQQERTGRSRQENAARFAAAIIDQPRGRRIISTEAELAEILSDDERSVTLHDSGGFVWWTEYTSASGNLLHGCADPARPGDTGQTIEAWMNAFKAPEAMAYGPFTVLYDSAEEPDQ